MKEKEEINEINENEINVKKAPTGRSKKVPINGDTALFMDHFYRRAGAARGVTDSPEYVHFYHTLGMLLEITDNIVNNRKAKKIFDEEAAYKRYVKIVNQLKKDAKAYETYKLSVKTENPKGEPGRKKVNSNDKEKLSIVRAVMNNTYPYFKVPVPAKTEAQKIREELRKADEALARLKEGKYENDPDKKKLLADASAALVAQMVRHSGGAVLIDRNTGKKISYATFKNRCIKDNIVTVLKNKKTNDYYMPRQIYNACVMPRFLQDVVKASMSPDKGKKRPEDALPKNAKAKTVMLHSLADDMEKLMLDISGTYGKGKSDSSPSKVMMNVLKAMRKLSAVNGKTADTPEGRRKDMAKLSPEDFKTRITQLENYIDTYLDKRPFPAKGDRIERQIHLNRLRHKLAIYKREFKDIESGKAGYIHKPKIGLERKGESIPYADLKKELLLFTFDMAGKCQEGKTVLNTFDPESYRIVYPTGNDVPPEPDPKLAALFTAMKDFKKIFMTDADDNVPKVSFDIIKEKVENIYKLGMIYRASIKGKSENNALNVCLKGLMDVWHDMLDNIEKLQPYMDMETVEGRIGSKNIYDVTKTMGRPYDQLLLIGSEGDMMTPKFNTQKLSLQARNSWEESKEALSHEKLLQKSLAKKWTVRDGLLLTYFKYAGDNLYIHPAGADLLPEKREERKVGMMRAVATHVFCMMADKEDLWSEIGQIDKGERVYDHLLEVLAGQVLRENRAFLNIHESATYQDIGEKFVAEAKRLGTFDQVKEAFNPYKIVDHVAKVEAEKNKKAEVKADNRTI